MLSRVNQRPGWGMSYPVVRSLNGRGSDSLAIKRAIEIAFEAEPESSETETDSAPAESDPVEHHGLSSEDSGQFLFPFIDLRDALESIAATGKPGRIGQRGAIDA